MSRLLYVFLVVLVHVNAFRYNRWARTSNQVATSSVQGTRTQALTMSMLATGVDHTAHATFLKEVALVNAPNELSTLLKLLELNGHELLDPSERSGMNPFLVPIAKMEDGQKMCFVRWPTMAENTESGLDLQIVTTTPMGGIRLHAMNADQLTRRIVAEMDFFGKSGSANALAILNTDSEKYVSGDYVPYLKSGKFPAITAEDLRLVLDRYILTKIGPFPDCYERLARNFKARDDIVSCLVTCERAVSLFYGFGHPVTFHANMLFEVSRDTEGRDAARSALGMPLWTVADTIEDLDAVALKAGFSGSEILGEMHLYRANDNREDEVGEDLPAEQLALDQAAHLMDAVVMGAIEGGWKEALPEISSKYEFAGYPDVAKFLRTNYV